MTQDAIAAIRNAARNLAEEALATHSDMVGIPANAQTADGYAQTVNCIAQALSGVADEVGKVTVPESYLRECWGKIWNMLRITCRLANSRHVKL